MTNRTVAAELDENTTLRLVMTDGAGGRQCGGCTLCCKLLPIKADHYPRERVAATVTAMIEHGMAQPGEFAGMMPEFDKPASQPCPHQRHGKGCNVYSRRPFGCRMWSCRWLNSDDTADLRRPDRSRYVIDIMPDFVTLRPDDGGAPTNIQVVQVWCDPKEPDAWRDPALRAYIERRAADGIATMIRFGSRGGAITVFAPAMSQDGQWHEVHGGKLVREHLGEALIEGLASARKVKVGS
jgi:hypothetical protein